MTVSSDKSKIKSTGNNDTKLESVKILSDIAKKDIEKSYNLEDVKGTEAYYSNRYGWTLRKSID